MRGSLRLWRINLVLLALAAGLLIAFVLVSFAVGRLPYDYALLMNGAARFCFEPDRFQYGDALRVYYPAPFYSTFCLPYRYAEPVLRWVWMLLPVGLIVWMARGRAAVLAYPPLADHTLLGQSTGLLLPQYWLAEHAEDGRGATFWHGLLVAVGVFKPHVAALAWVWLAMRWRGCRHAYAGWLIGLLLLCIPAFALQPDWLSGWLGTVLGGRAADSAMGRASLYLVAERLAIPPPIGIAGCALAAGLLAWAIRQRRGRLTFYDWTLVFALGNPLLNAYDLLILLPGVVRTRRRLAIALVTGGAAWLFALLTGRFSLSVMIPVCLVAERLLRPAPAAANASPRS